jgi:hypothetical protein
LPIPAAGKAKEGKMPQKGTNKKARKARKAELSSEELAKQQGEPLPERDVMSVINPVPPLGDGRFADGGHLPAQTDTWDGDDSPPPNNSIEPPPPTA